MISRRNIRVKVMQLLYGLETMEDTGKTDPVKTLRQNIDASKDLFVYLVHVITEIARHAEKYAVRQASKNLPSAEDLNVNIKLAGNEVVWKILESESYKASLANLRMGNIDHAELIRKLYIELTETPEYQAYIAAQQREKGKERDIVKFIFTNIMLPSESFTSHIEEHFNNWDDDAEMMVQLVSNYLQKPASFDLREMITEEKWKFAQSLLQTAREKKEYVAELIKPKLKNWDAERIAQLDMIMMRMGVCEFLYFETIPPKVTINEYIDIAKEYSTQQSGQFVNGVLDNIHKELLATGKIQKIDFNKQKA
ncbi:MAG: nusB [Chitinophagaceae bacterium]|jgi:N utilization substance protein B|nr:nusB [Chitinophagaceae bacterium]